MPPNQLQHRRTHNVLLVRKILDYRDITSPFTLIIDSLEQSARPLVQRVISRAKSSNTRVVFVAFETLKKPLDVDVFVSAHSLNLQGIRREMGKYTSESKQRTVVIFDSLNILLQEQSASSELSSILSSFINPNTSLLAVYHSDVPAPRDISSYSPSPLTLLKYLATTILIMHSLSHVLAAKQARQRSLGEPVFGLAEEKEGIIIGLGSHDQRGTVVEMEYRRKSGRAVHELFFLPNPASFNGRSALSAKETLSDGIMLLDDHPVYRIAGAEGLDVTSAAAEQDVGMDSTFSLGLTEKQRRDREGVVLPYFDAQNEDGMGEGGRILYEMGVEDDFDEEEDEI